MLTEKQIEAFAVYLNKDFSIPFLSEESELKHLRRVLREINDILAQRLGREIYDKIHTTEGIPAQHIDLIKKNMVRELNRRIDLPIIDEHDEAILLKLIVDKLTDAMKEDSNLMDEIMKDVQ